MKTIPAVGRAQAHPCNRLAGLFAEDLMKYGILLSAAQTRPPSSFTRGLSAGEPALAVQHCTTLGCLPYKGAHITLRQCSTFAGNGSGAGINYCVSYGLP